MIICRNCKNEKSENDFYVINVRGKKYRIKDCKKCYLELTRETRQRKLKEWRKKVLDRDNYTCQRCKKKKDLVAHHIVEWKESVKLRYELSNGETLCRSCHMKHHQGINSNLKGSRIPWNKGKKTGIGGTKKGSKLTDAHKKKLSQAKKGRSLSEKHCKSLINCKSEKSKIENKLRFKNKTWIIDPVTNKRVWIEKVQGD